MNAEQEIPYPALPAPAGVTGMTDGQEPPADDKPIPVPAIFRFVLGCWDGLVWLLLVAMPGVWQSTGMAGFALHFPYVLIGLVILGGAYYALRALADGHLVWFSIVLFLLGTWM